MIQIEITHPRNTFAKKYKYLNIFSRKYSTAALLPRERRTLRLLKKTRYWLKHVSHFKNVFSMFLLDPGIKNQEGMEKECLSS